MAEQSPRKSRKKNVHGLTAVKTSLVVASIGLTIGGWAVMARNDSVLATDVDAASIPPTVTVQSVPPTATQSPVRRAQRNQAPSAPPAAPPPTATPQLKAQASPTPVAPQPTPQVAPTQRPAQPAPAPRTRTRSSR
jgi:hypothetical protein